MACVPQGVEAKSTLRISTQPVGPGHNYPPGVSNVVAMSFSGVVHFTKVHVTFPSRAKLSRATEPRGEDGQLRREEEDQDRGVLGCLRRVREVDSVIA